MELKELKERIYGMAIEKRDFNKMDKIINGIEKGEIKKENFYEEIRKLTKNVYSDHSIGRWQCISEYVYKLLQ